MNLEQFYESLPAAFGDYVINICECESLEQASGLLESLSYTNGSRQGLRHPNHMKIYVGTNQTNATTIIVAGRMAVEEIVEFGQMATKHKLEVKRQLVARDVTGEVGKNFFRAAEDLRSERRSTGKQSRPPSVILTIQGGLIAAIWSGILEWYSLTIGMTLFSFPLAFRLTKWMGIILGLDFRENHQKRRGGIGFRLIHFWFVGCFVLLIWIWELPVSSLIWRIVYSVLLFIVGGNIGDLIDRLEDRYKQKFKTNQPK